ncbi:MAG: kelch repeat-containing protein [bacterium]
MRRFLQIMSIALFVVSLCSTLSFSQTGKWTQLFPTNSPPARCEFGMAYLGDNKILIFSGYGYSNLSYKDTWLYDYSENEWKEVICETKPRPRSAPAMVSLSEGKVLLFGGDAYNAYGDTWVFDLSLLKWTEMHTERAPIGRWGAGCANLGNGEVLLNGGSYLNSELTYNDTWIYNLTKNNWDSLTIESPKGRKLAQMCEINDNSIMLYGGSIGDTLLNDINIYDNDVKKWKICNPKVDNLFRDAASMVNLTKNFTYVFGGWNNETKEINDSWIFDFEDSTWIELNFDLQPQVRCFHSMVKINDGLAILFGGSTNTEYFNDTWLFEYDPTGVKDSTNVLLAQVKVINIANGNCEIQLSNLSAGNIDIELYNTNGDFVKKLYSNYNAQPNFNLEFNTAEFSSGAYFLEIKTKDAIYHKQIMVVR